MAIPRGSLAFIFLILASSVALTACVSAPPAHKVSVSERIEFDRAIGTELASQLEPQLTFKKEAKIHAYLQKMSELMAEKNPDIRLPTVKIFMLQDRGRKHQSYSLPGGRLYLSAGSLKVADYANEIAAVVAIQMGHLFGEDVLDYLRSHPSGLRAHQEASLPGVLPIKTAEAPDNVDFFGADGVFAFNAKSNDEAVQSAVNIMYNAGYDPRGLVAFIQYYIDNPSRSPWELGEASRLQDVARKQISILAPLRNPIVQTDAFELIRSSLQKL